MVAVWILLHGQAYEAEISESEDRAIEDARLSPTQVQEFLGIWPVL